MLLRVAVAVCMGSVIGIATLSSGLQPPIQDVQYDWLSAMGAIHSDAYAPVLELANEFGVSVELRAAEGIEEIIHPRLPGAILLALPLTLLDFDVLFSFAAGLSAACLTFMMLVCGPRTRAIVGVTIGALVAISIPTLLTFAYATQSAVVALLTLGGWVLIERERDRLGGALIGLAATLKVFPGLLLIPMVRRGNTRASMSLVGAAIGANLLGLFLPGVGLRGAVEALTDANTIWGGLTANASLLGIVGGRGLDPRLSLALCALLGVILLWAVYRAGPRSSADPLPWLIVGLLAIPLSWVHYDLILLPAIAAVAAGTDSYPRSAALLLPVLWLVPSLLTLFGQVQPGPWFFASRLLLLATWGLGGLRRNVDESQATWRLGPMRLSRPRSANHGVARV